MNLLQNEYETAFLQHPGSPTGKAIKKVKNIALPILWSVASDEKNSGQGIIFGTKPLEILIPYIKVLTNRNDLIIEPFGGSGSTLVASEKMKRRCFVMEKTPVYCEVIKKDGKN